MGVDITRKAGNVLDHVENSITSIDEAYEFIENSIHSTGEEGSQYLKELFVYNYIIDQIKNKFLIAAYAEHLIDCPDCLMEFRKARNKFHDLRKKIMSDESICVYINNEKTEDYEAVNDSLKISLAKNFEFDNKAVYVEINREEYFYAEFQAEDLGIYRDAADTGRGQPPEMDVKRKKGIDSNGIEYELVTDIDNGSADLYVAII